jgi:hypothetical protein
LTHETTLELARQVSRDWIRFLDGLAAMLGESGRGERFERLRLQRGNERTEEEERAAAPTVADAGVPKLIAGRQKKLSRLSKCPGAIRHWGEHRRDTVRDVLDAAKRSRLMDIHSIAPPEWVAARKALVQDLTRLRDQYAFGLSSGRREMFAGRLLACDGDEFAWTGRLDRLEAYLAA